MNKEDNKNNVKKNTIILLLCVIVFTIILVSVIIVFSVGGETTPTYSKVNNTNTNITTNNTNTNNSNNNVSKQLPSYVEKVNNYMTFNMTISDFVKKLNDTSTYNINPINEEDFRYLGDVPQENGITLKIYLYEQINPANGAKNGKGISLQIEPTGKIAAIRYLSRSGIYTDDIRLQRILNITVNRTKDESINIIEKAKNSLGQSFTSNELHFGYQYWDANGVPAFELFAM